MRINPPDEVERIFIVGKNGTGKSELTYALEAAGKYRSVYMDIKGDSNPRQLDAAGVPWSLVKRGDDQWGWRHRRIVYRPEPGTYWRTDRGWAQILERIFIRSVRAYDHKRQRSREPRLLIIPEVLLFGPHAQKVIADIASGGRQLELGLWIESQRPRRIPVVIRSEAWRWYIFPLGYQDDELEVLKNAKGRLDIAQLRELDDDVDPRDPHPFIELLLRSRSGAQIAVRRCGSLPPPP